MKKTSIVWMVMVLAGVSQAGVIYSNNFNGVEFKAAGVGDSAYRLTEESGGRLVSTNSSLNLCGFSVDLTGLGLGADANVTAVKLSISGKAPLTADGTAYLGLGFLNSAAGVNLNNNGLPVIRIPGNGDFRGTGGAGFGNNLLATVGQGDNFTAGGEFTMDLIYYKDSTIDAWYNNVQVYNKQAVSHTVTPTLQSAAIQFRGLIVADGANIDTFTIDVIPEPATLGLVAITGTLVLFIRRMFVI